MSPVLETMLVLAALNMALWNRRPTSGVLHHSDRGTQYTSLAFGRRCREAGVVPSMGSAGSAYDNALAEAFFATLETKLLQRQAFLSRGAARVALFDYIEGFYNSHRRHSALRYLSPAEFERRWHQEQSNSRMSPDEVRQGNQPGKRPQVRFSVRREVSGYPQGGDVIRGNRLGISPSTDGQLHREEVVGAERSSLRYQCAAKL